MNAPCSFTEANRLKALYDCEILHTAQEQSYDDIVALAAMLCGTPIAAISLVDEKSQWLKARFGLDVRDLPQKQTFCRQAITRPDTLLIVEDAHLDRRFADNVHVVGLPFIRFYAGAPLVTSTGHVLGTLCVMDQASRRLDQTQQQALCALARQVVVLIEFGRNAVRLNDRENHFQAFFERSMVGMATMNVKKRWTEVNDALCAMLGYPRDELLRLSCSDLTHPDDLPAHNERMAQVLRGELSDYEIEKRLIHKDGRTLHIQAAIRCVRTACGEPDYFVALMQDVTQHRHSEERIWRQANFDELTQLPNRHLFCNRLNQEIKKADRNGSRIGLMLIDLDHFMEVNDTLGHDKGDQLLGEAAHRIRQCVRNTDIVARMGGDEFFVAVGPLADVAHLERISIAIVESLRKPFQLDDDEVHISASLGLTLYPSDATDVDHLIRNADQAMFLSKQRGRNCYSFFTRSLQEEAITRQRLLADLRGALAADQFRIVFQPIVELKTGRICKAEALLRWQHPTRGLVSPAEFIPMAEESGLIVDIGAWVVQEAMQWSLKWKQLCHDGMQISVNISPVQFKSPNFQIDLLVQALALHPQPSPMIAFEITEGILLNAEAQVVSRLDRIRHAGIAVSIDDFGTGYSSLAYLKKFQIDYLKIDQSFIRNLENDSSDMVLTEAMIVMAHKLGLKVIAEGVETPRQKQLLEQAGCDYVQGYLIAKPLAPEAFTELLRQAAQTKTSC